MDRNGQNSRRLTYTNTGWSRGPTWSPDGRWIAFVSNQEGSAGEGFGEVFVVSVDTGKLYQVTETGGQVFEWRVSWTK
jgi:Tol biopolymer transport system component